MSMKWLFCLGAALAGCNDPTYLGEGRQLKTGDAAGGGITTDTDTFTIPIRPPKDSEQKKLDDEQASKMLPMPVPWIGVRDMPVEIEYTVRNLDGQPAHVFFRVIGGSEFGTYDPANFGNPNDPNAVVPPPLLGATPIDLQPAGAAGDSVQLAFREDDLAEAGVDVEAIVRYPGPSDPTIPFKVLTARSDTTTIGFDQIPPNDVTPQVMILTFTLTADAHVTADYVVRVRDLNGRLAPPGSTDLFR
jgi:hypothetical protein